MSREDPRSQYKETWNRLSPTLDAARTAILGTADESEFARTAAGTAKQLRKTVGIRPDDTILEIGCGIGRVGSALAPHCREWIGTDVSPNMLAFAADQLRPFDNIRLVELSGFDLGPIESSCVDLVYCHVLFMHLWPFDRYSYVLEAMRVLRPNGRVFIDNVDLLTDEGWAMFEHHRTLFSPSERPAHMSMMSTPDELVAYLTHAGFTHIQTRNLGLWVQSWATKPCSPV